MEGLSHYSPEEKNNKLKTEKKERSLKDMYIIFTSYSGNLFLCIFFCNRVQWGMWNYSNIEDKNFTLESVKDYKTK